MHDTTYRALADARAADFAREAERSRLAGQVPRPDGRISRLRLLAVRVRARARASLLRPQLTSVGRGLQSRPESEITVKP
jgi:hypothetical protein